MKIADIELGEKPLLLAPMEDVTDPSFRYMCKRFGADVVYTEFISSDGLIRDAAKSLKKLEIDAAERPVGIQLYGHLIEPMVEAARMADVINNRWVLDATFRGHYAADTMEAATKLAHIAGGELDVRDEDIAALTAALPYNDCLGVNTYKCQFLRAAEGENDINHNGTGDKGSSRWFLKGVGESCVREGVPTTDWDWIIYPEGLYDLLLRIKNDYPNYKKIYITENGMGYKDDFEDGFIDDAPRIDYMRQHLAWILKAIDGGVNVDGYFVWSLQDQFSWTNGYNKRYGLFYIDFETQKRYPKASAYWYKNVAETGLLMA